MNIAIVTDKYKIFKDFIAYYNFPSQYFKMVSTIHDIHGNKFDYYVNIYCDSPVRGCIEYLTSIGVNEIQIDELETKFKDGL